MDSRRLFIVRSAIGVLILFVSAMESITAENNHRIQSGTTHSYAAEALALSTTPTVESASNTLLDHNNKILSGIYSAYGDSPETSDIRAQNQTDTQPNNENMLGYMGKMLISLAFVILLVLGFAWFAKRYIVKDRTLGGSHIHLLASYALSQKSQVHLLRVGQECFLVGEGGSSLTMLSKVELPSGSRSSMSALNAQDEDYNEGNTLSRETGEQTESFGERLSQWQSALQDKDMSQEVRNSLLLLGNLTQRLRKKGGPMNE